MRKTIFSLLFILSLLVGVSTPVFAEGSFYIDDEAGFLSADELDALYDMDLSDLLKVGSVEVLLTDSLHSDSAVESTGKELAGSSGLALVICFDGDYRYTFAISGNSSKISDRDCYSVVDNVYRDVAKKKYYEAVKEALKEFNTIASGGIIFRPLQWASAFFFAIMLSGMIVGIYCYWIVKPKMRSATDKAGSLIARQFPVCNVNTIYLNTRTYTKSSSSGGGGGHGGGGGGHSGGGHH